MMRFHARGAALLAAALSPALVVGQSVVTEWCTPVPVTSLNSPLNDNGPEPRANERILYFGSSRVGGEGQGDLWASRRAGRDDAWGPPVNLDAGGDPERGVNTRYIDNAPALWNGGHVLFFASDRPVPERPVSGYGCGPAATPLPDRSCDIWVAERTHTRDDQAWSEPWNLGEPVNGEYAEGMGDLFQDESTGTTTLYFLSNRPRDDADTQRDYDIYASTLDDEGAFGDPVLVENVNSDQDDQRVNIAADGLVMLFQSSRPGGQGSSDVWMATRERTDDAWSDPVNLGPPVNGPLFEGGPRLSANGETLYFFRGSAPDVDLYVSARARADGTCDE